MWISRALWIQSENLCWVGTVIFSKVTSDLSSASSKVMTWQSCYYQFRLPLLRTFSLWIIVLGILIRTILFWNQSCDNRFLFERNVKHMCWLSAMIGHQKQEQLLLDGKGILSCVQVEWQSLQKASSSRFIMSQSVTNRQLRVRRVLLPGWIFPHLPLFQTSKETNGTSEMREQLT